MTEDRDFGPLEQTIGVRFSDPAVLRSALTHSSYANEHPEDPTPTNERLEFLGDAVLGMVVAEALYQRYEDMPEGRLTEWRALLVCGPTLGRVGERLALGRWLRLGRGEESTGGRERETNLERAYEALVGAIYLDRGLEAAGTFVERTLGPEIEAMEESEALNPKGALQQFAQGMNVRPEYRVTSESGPEHDRRFAVEVSIGGEVLGSGSGSSKQQAEKEAARLALDVLRARAASTPDGGASDGGAPDDDITHPAG